MEQLRPLLPAKYAPLQKDGRGVQAIYLTELSRSFALALADLIGTDISAIARNELAADQDLVAPRSDLVLWEEHLRNEIQNDAAIPATEREALVLARRGRADSEKAFSASSDTAE